jgi:hypothetical protein
MLREIVRQPRQYFRKLNFPAEKLRLQVRPNDAVSLPDKAC